MTDNIEKILLEIDEKLTLAAFEKLNNGQASQVQVSGFYRELSTWNEQSQRVLEMAEKIGLDPARN